MPSITTYRSSADKTAPFFTWSIFAVYLTLLAISISHHELWGDELHSWNIAKASGSFTELLHNTRYEGHPPVWYTLMWLLSKCTHNLVYLQCLQFCIISATIFVFLFYSPFPKIVKALLPFGYFFLYEYGTLSRNYAVGVLLAFIICLLLQRQGKTNYILYYLSLLLLSNTHLLGLLLAAALHLYFLLRNMEKTGRKNTVMHLLPGCIILLPAIYFIFPPGDSQLNMHFWLSIRNSHILADMAVAPVKAFLTIPAWWNYHFWNTNFLDTAGGGIRFILSALLILLIIVTLKNDRRSMLLFIANFLLTCTVEMLFSMTSIRYLGFLFISFIVACWLHYARQPLNKTGLWILCSILFVQICGSIIAVSRDVKYPFSNAYKVNELLQQVPAGEKSVSDYWCLNNVAAYTGKPFYCIELNRKISFLLWDNELSHVIATHAPYTNGFNNMFRTMGILQTWMISTNAPEALMKKDSSFPKIYHVQLTRKTEGSIESGGELYLYYIRK
ncbi:hypothetical protein ACTHGU_18040 [Chitinophagaceae bacterium MMS25-I14]